jgi:hypothetical protein
MLLFRPNGPKITHLRRPFKMHFILSGSGEELSNQKSLSGHVAQQSYGQLDASSYTLGPLVGHCRSATQGLGSQMASRKCFDLTPTMQPRNKPGAALCKSTESRGKIRRYSCMTLQGFPHHSLRKKPTTCSALIWPHSYCPQVADIASCLCSSPVVHLTKNMNVSND